MSVVKAAIRVLDKYTLSPALFHHHSGLVGVASGKAKLRKSGRGKMSGYPLDEYAEIGENHWIDLGQPYQDSLVETIASKFQDYIEEEEYTMTSGYNGSVYNRTLRSYGDNSYGGFDFGEHIPEINELLFGRVADALKSYYGTHFEPDYVQAYRNYHVPDEVVRKADIFSNYWHTDQEPIDFVKLFITLSDVTEDHGPLHLVSRSDTKRILGRSFVRSRDGVPGGVIEEQAGELLRATGPIGSAYLANTNYLLHRAGIPAEGNQRDILVVRLTPSSTSLPDDWLNDPEISLVRDDRTPY